MKQIVPHLLWLGHAREGDDFKQVFEVGVQALVELAVEELPSRPPRELIYCRFPILDGPGNDAGVLSLAVHTIGTLIDRRLPALVCCSSGRSRSPALVAAALAVVRHKPATEALKEVAEHSPSDVSPGLWKEILDLLSGLGVPRA